MVSLFLHLQLFFVWKHLLLYGELSFCCDSQFFHDIFFFLCDVMYIMCKNVKRCLSNLTANTPSKVGCVSILNILTLFRIPSSNPLLYLILNSIVSIIQIIVFAMNFSVNKVQSSAHKHRTIVSQILGSNVVYGILEFRFRAQLNRAVVFWAVRIEIQNFYKLGWPMHTFSLWGFWSRRIRFQIVVRWVNALHLSAVEPVVTSFVSHHFWLRVKVVQNFQCLSLWG